MRSINRPPPPPPPPPLLLLLLLVLPPYTQTHTHPATQPATNKQAGPITNTVPQLARSVKLTRFLTPESSAVQKYWCCGAINTTPISKNCKPCYRTPEVPSLESGSYIQPSKSFNKIRRTVFELHRYKPCNKGKWRRCQVPQ